VVFPKWSQDTWVSEFGTFILVLSVHATDFDEEVPAFLFLFLPHEPAPNSFSTSIVLLSPVLLRPQSDEKDPSFPVINRDSLSPCTFGYVATGQL